VSRPVRLAAALLLGAVGCGRPAEPAPPDTGAKDAARGYFDAVIRRDWPAAYAGLHPDTTKSLPAADFARRAEAYRRQLGFEPTAVHLRTCEENGDRATARVELTGSGSGRHRYKDAVTLRNEGGKWLLVLPPRFGLR
jgi:hypothetical protein